MAVLLRDDSHSSIANLAYLFWREDQIAKSEVTSLESAHPPFTSTENEDSSSAALLHEGTIDDGLLLRPVEVYGMGEAVVFFGLYGSQGCLVPFSGMLPPSLPAFEGTTGSDYDPGILFLDGTQGQEIQVEAANQALADLSSLVEDIKSLRTLTVSQDTWKLAAAAAEAVSSHTLTESEIEEWATRIANSVSDSVD